MSHVHDVSLSAIEKAWEREVEKCVAAFASGELRSYPVEDVFSEICRSKAPGRVRRARFITEARQEFLAQVVYYNEAQLGYWIGRTPIHGKFVLETYRHSGEARNPDLYIRSRGW